MSNVVRSLLAIGVAGLVAACASGGASSTSQPTGNPPTAAPTAPPTTPSGIVHPTGPKDVVLRFDESGGFVPVEFLAAHVPYFTLYGDGTVVFVRTAALIDPGPDAVVPGVPLRTARLSEDQVQRLLELALNDGGLAIARPAYQNPLVADAPTAVFEINAAGDHKTVSVVALGMQDQPGADSAVKAALARLGDRLRDFDQGGSLSSAEFHAASWRGVLTDSGGAVGVKVRPWPWPTLGLDDFGFPADPNQLRQGTRSMTADEIEALGIAGAEHGVQSGAYVSGPDGKTYSLVVRPLLPDEAA